MNKGEVKEQKKVQKKKQKHEIVVKDIAENETFPIPRIKITQSG